MKFFFWKDKRTQKHQEPLKTENRFVYQNKTKLRLTGNSLLISLILCVVLITITLRDSLIDKNIQNIFTRLFQYSTFHGFSIDDIVIEGRHYTSKEALNEQINLSRSKSILEVDLEQLKEKIETLPWVEQAYLKRSYFPNILHILIKEKQIIALFQKDGKFYPVDEKGNILDVDFTPTRPYLILVGSDAAKQFFKLNQITSKTPDLHERIKAAVLHASSRWDLVFDDLENGIVVKLPENNVEEAWKKLLILHHKYGIFKRKLTFIDLRYKDKVTVNIAD